jgi:UDP-N-acetylmuramoyl-tripeptide--D-alanyl-D-alanine ligase
MEPRTLKCIAELMEGDLLAGAPERTVARVSTDSRHTEPGDLFFALGGERFDGHSFLPEVARRGVAAVVAERQKVPPGLEGCGIILVDNTRRALGRLGAGYRRDFTLPIVAVGGSNGKTTTKELIASVLRQKKPALWSEASYNNDIGVPLTLLRLEKTHQAAVLETGTNHPGELKGLLRMIAPRLGVVTNIGREHLEFFKDLTGVVREEGEMAEALPKDGVLFLNGDNPWSEVIARRTRARTILAGLERHNDCVARDVRMDENGAVFFVECRYPGLSGEYRAPRPAPGRQRAPGLCRRRGNGPEPGGDRARPAGLRSRQDAPPTLQPRRHPHPQ